MVQNGRRLAENLGDIILSALRPMKPSIIGFFMMQNLNLNITDRSHGQKWLKMAAFSVNSKNNFSSAIRPMKLVVTGFLIMPNSNLAIYHGSCDRK